MFLFSSPPKKKEPEQQPKPTNLLEQKNKRDKPRESRKRKREPKSKAYKRSNSVLNFFRFSRTEASEEEDSDGSTGEGATADAIRSTEKVFMERRALPDNFAEEVMDLEF